MINYLELSKVIVCAGTRHSCSYYTITQQGLQPNKNGQYIDCKPTNFGAIVKSMRDKTFTIYCQKEADSYNRTHPEDIRDLKAYAVSVYAFKDHRYVVEEKIINEENKIINKVRTNDAYNHWTGFKGFDFDPDKSKFAKEERREIGLVFKRILYDNLKKYNWFIGSGLSTGGHGTHIYTAIQLTKTYHDLSIEEKIRYHDMCYWYMFLKMIPCLKLLVEEIDYMTLEDAKEMLDTAMLKVGQTLNITPMDNNPFINDNFKYEELEDVLGFLNNTKEDYPTFDDSTYMMFDEEQKNLYQIFLDVCIGNINKLTKHYKNTKRTKVTINKCDDFDIHLLDNIKGPWHFQHKRKNGNKFWTGNQIIHTLSFFFSKDTIKNIWMHPKFYDEDPKDWVRFVDDPRWYAGSYLPNFKLIQWLNKNCNMDLSYEFEEEKDDRYVIRLKDDEYLYDKREEIFDNLKNGVNLLESDTGTGKTTFVIKYFKDIVDKEKDILNYNSCHTNTIITEPYNSVIDSKFNDLFNEGIVDIVKKSKRIKIIENKSSNVCTNYYHINLLKDDDIDKVDLLIIDESHLLFAEAYRFGSISEFIHKIYKFKKVILMTGTPIYEYEFFKDCNIIYAEKKDPRYITHEFLRFQPCTEVKYFNICALSEFVHTLVGNGKKVFIYDKDISLQNCKRFKSLNSDLKIAIYHKKHADEPSKTEDMQWIDENHMLGDKFDVIISSCYFSVGNDLYDEGKAAVIMVGMHIPSEIIQVDGRWRNMAEINIYTIIKDKYEEIEDDLDKDKLYNHKRNEIIRIKNDYTNKDSSITIFKKYKVVNDEDIDLLSYMETLPVHQKTISFINYELSKHNVWCDERIMPLVYNYDFIEKNKLFSKTLKDNRSEIKKKFIDDLLQKRDVEWITTDNKIEVWQKTVYIMFKHVPINLFKENIRWIINTSFIDSMILFNKLNNKISKNDVDYAEIYSMVKTSEQLLEAKEEYMLREWLSHNDWECIKGYVLFMCFYNKDQSKNKMIEGNYFKEFKNMCFDYYSIPTTMKEYLFRDENQIDLNSFEYVVSDQQHIIQVQKIPFDDYQNKFERNKNNQTLKNIELKLFNELLLMLRNKKAYAGKIGGKNSSPKRQCVITNKMKKSMLEKYNLEVNQTFDSMGDLAKYVNKTPKTITEWKDKDWIAKR